MPPDYPQKKIKARSEEESKSRLDSLEERVYSAGNSTSKSESKFDFKLGVGDRLTPVAVRSEWAEAEAPKEKMAEGVSSRNTYAILKQILIGSVALFLVSAGVAGYVFWGGSNVISTKNISIKINMPSTVPGGEKLPVEISISNQNNVPLLSADVLVEYSDGGRTPEDLSKELRRYREALGPIEVNTVINKKYSVVFFGEEGEAKNVKVTLEYRVKGSNAIFSKSESHNLALSSAPVSVSIDSQSESAVGDEATFVVKVVANSSQSIANPMISADYPFGFEFTGATPKPTYGNNVWDLGTLQPGASRVITVRGKFSGLEGEERSLRFIVGSRDSKDSRRVGVVFLAKTFSVMLTRPNLGLDLVLGGSPGAEFSARAGANIRGDIVLHNNLNSRIANIVITAKPKGSIFDRNSVSVSTGFYRSIDNTIIWDEKTAPQLADLGPGGSLNLGFTFGTLRSAVSQESPSMSMDVVVTGYKMDNGEKSLVQTAVSRVVKIASEMQLSTYITHNGGPFTDIGLVPPKAELETTYTIKLRVTNSTNTLSGVEVNTSLPIYVKWMDKISPESENIKYNPTGGGVVWAVGEMKAGSSKEVSFQVSFTPSINQVGMSPDLVNDVSGSGYDGFSGQNIRASFGSVYSNITLQGDSIYKGRGGPVVQ